MIGRSKQKITNLVMRRVSQHGVALGGFGAVLLLFFFGCLWFMFESPSCLCPSLLLFASMR
jgi:hypothetical protein